MYIKKYGRTSGYTEGKILYLGATVGVDYDELGKIYFEKQIVTSPISQPGDSGSLVLEKDTNLVVGLLYGGSDRASLVNPIETVLAALGVNFNVKSNN
jgi:hypothetical protein